MCSLCLRTLLSVVLSTKAAARKTAIVKLSDGIHLGRWDTDSGWRQDDKVHPHTRGDTHTQIMFTFLLKLLYIKEWSSQLRSLKQPLSLWTHILEESGKQHKPPLIFITPQRKKEESLSTRPTITWSPLGYHELTPALKSPRACCICGS